MLSVVVPAYKQEKTIKRDIRRVLLVLSKIRFKFELIVVVDGEVDATYTRAKTIKHPKLKVLSYATNHGKGYAVRYGMKRARGEYIAFLDAGMDLDPNGVSMIMEHMIWYKADCIVGSKRHPASQVHYPLLRRIYSYGYHLLTKILFRLSLKDTQVGLKVFRKDLLADVLPRLLVKKHAFDIELLAVARRRGYVRMYEAPISLEYNFTSTIKTGTVYEMLWDTLAVFYRMYILHYYDKPRRKWRFDKELKMRVNVG